jgi:hypothetical protein
MSPENAGRKSPGAVILTSTVGDWHFEQEGSRTTGTLQVGHHFKRSLPRNGTLEGIVGVRATENLDVSLFGKNFFRDIKNKISWNEHSGSF